MNTERNSYDGRIFLYGEIHNSERIKTKELELWHDYYHNEGMRHLFIEFPNYMAAFLNVWMKSDSDDMLNAVYDGWGDTLAGVSSEKDLFRRIKAECPETVFHGTDIGHRYNPTGIRYLLYLEENGMEDSDEYSAACEAIAQGVRAYGLTGEMDDLYRENKMAENFIRAFEKLNWESVMGIYGAVHTQLDGTALTSDSHPCMANQLRARYGERVRSEDLSRLALLDEPLRTETLIVNGKEYEASYFGEQDLSSYTKEVKKREFWRLENAYGDFAENQKPGGVLPYNNYPMPIEKGQVFVVDYTQSDDAVMRVYFRSDGNEFNGKPTTEAFFI